MRQDSATYLVLFLVAYFLPALIAYQRGHPQSVAIFVTDLFLGWTVLGWIGALIWSVTAINPLLRDINLQADVLDVINRGRVPAPPRRLSSDDPLVNDIRDVVNNIRR